VPWLSTLVHQIRLVAVVHLDKRRRQHEWATQRETRHVYPELLPVGADEGVVPLHVSDR